MLNRHMIRRRPYVLALGLILLLVGCQSGAVVFVPTATPFATSPLTYTHPSRAFSLAVPRNWSVHEQNTPTLAAASFAPPHQPPLITVAVINLGQELDDSQLGTVMFEYQTMFRPDLTRYTESDRQAMGDGSWRLTGVRQSAAGQPQQINTFILRQGTFLGVLDAVIPTDPQVMSDVQSSINTLRLDPTAVLQPAAPQVLSEVAIVGLEIVHVSTWVTPQGVFFITGEVANHSVLAMSQIPVRAVLYTADGTAVTEALDVVMGHVLLPGQFAPFSLRFGQGQPPETTTYTLTVGREDWQPDDVPTVVSSDALAWTHETSYNENRHLRISGTITNMSQQTVRQVRAVVTLFDDQGEVIAAGFTEVESPLLAGDTTNYSILVSDIGGLPANYIVDVQALTASR